MKSFYEKMRAYPRNRHSGSFLALICVWAFVGAGCAALEPGVEEPTLVIASFEPMPLESITPTFEIAIRVVNPNTRRLALPDMPYKLFVNGTEVANGIARELPSVPAYGAINYTVIAKVDQPEGMRVFSNLTQDQHSMVDYRFQVKLDIGVRARTLKVERTGKFYPVFPSSL